MRYALHLSILLHACSLFSSRAHAQSTTAILFDGQGTQVTIGKSALFNITGALTLEAWVKVDPQQTCPYPRIINKFNHVENKGYNLIVNNGRLYLEVRDVNGKLRGAAGGPINDGMWHHVAGTFTNTTMRVYKDGALDAETTFAPTAIAVSGNDLRIGFDGGSERSPFKGAIDEVRIWNVARSAEEIRANKGLCLGGREQGLVGYWRFDEGSGTTMRDQTGRGNDGVLAGGGAWVASGFSCASVEAVVDAAKEIASLFKGKKGHAAGDGAGAKEPATPVIETKQAAPAQPQANSPADGVVPATTSTPSQPTGSAVAKAAIRSLDEKSILPVLFPEGRFEAKAFAWTGEPGSGAYGGQMAESSESGGHIAIDTIIRFRQEGTEKAAVVMSHYTLENGRRQMSPDHFNGLSCAVMARAADGSWEPSVVKRGIMDISSFPVHLSPRVQQIGKDNFVLQATSVLYIVPTPSGDPIEDEAYMNVKDLERVFSRSLGERVVFLPSDKAWYDVDFQGYDMETYEEKAKVRMVWSEAAKKYMPVTPPRKK
jgi:hypothetical protein